jgi:hypothetical protein
MLLPRRCTTVSRRPTSAERYLAGGCGPALVRVGVVDVDDAPAEGRTFDDRAGRLDLGSSGMATLLAP